MRRATVLILGGLVASGTTLAGCARAPEDYIPASERAIARQESLRQAGPITVDTMLARARQGDAGAPGSPPPVPAPPSPTAKPSGGAAVDITAVPLAPAGSPSGRSLPGEFGPDQPPPAAGTPVSPPWARSGPVNGSVQPVREVQGHSPYRSDGNSLLLHFTEGVGTLDLLPDDLLLLRSKLGVQRWAALTIGPADGNPFEAAATASRRLRSLRQQLPPTLHVTEWRYDTNLDTDTVRIDFMIASDGGKSGG